MKTISKKILLAMWGVLAYHDAYAVTSFTSPALITNFVQDPQTGTMLLTCTGGASNNAIQLLNRPTTTDTAPTTTGIAADSTLRNANVTLATLMPDPTTPTNPSLLKVASVLQITHAYNENDVYLITTTAGTATTITPNDVAGNAAGAVVGLTSGNTSTPTQCIFAAVNKTGTTTNFGSNTTDTVQDGIAVITVDQSTLVLTQGANASMLDASNTGSLCFNGTANTTTVAAGQKVPMAYDADLGMLYVGVPVMTTNAGNPNTAIVSIAGYSVAGSGALTQKAMIYSADSAGTTPAAIAGITNIIATKNSAGVYSQSLSATNIAIMTSSTGSSSASKFKYLIVNGGNGLAAATGNRVWAIPLVPKYDASGNATTNPGSFADVTTGDFSTIANASGDLYTTATVAAQVGNGVLPMAASSAIAAMMVHGDAVYVSISGAASATNNPGLYCSQAIFDNLGKVVGWSDWHKLAPTDLGYFGSAFTSIGRTGLFVVDPVLGQMFVADGVGNTTVAVSQWMNTSLDPDNAVNTTGLIYNLNQTTNVGDGCTASCDLNASSTAWGNVTQARMAIFGGVDGKVCFAMTGSAYAATSGLALDGTNPMLEHVFSTSSTTAALDYSSSNTLLLTNLPSGAGTVRALSYSGWYPVTGTTAVGYFFAGAETGGGDGALYVYSAATLGAGFDTSTLTNFGGAPFAGGSAFSWQQLTNCDGIPVKIEAAGGAVYILTRKVDASGATTDRIFRITKKATATLLNADFVVTATAGAVNGAVDLSAVHNIYDFVVSQTSSASTTAEQLTMLTNDGIYTTTASLGCDSTTYTPANAMLSCGWTKVTSPASADNFMVKFFRPTHNTYPQTLWAGQWFATTTNPNVYDNIQLVQYGRQTNAVSTFGQDPTNFNAYDGTTTVPAGFAALPVMSYLYSDGLRRFAPTVERSTTSGHSMKLLSLPYNTSNWNLSSPYTSQDTNVQNLGAVYWVRDIAGTLMIGTSNGVVAQQ